MDLVQVPGKRNRKVRMLITLDVGEAMQLLVKKRNICGIPSQKPLFLRHELRRWLLKYVAGS
jgi:hypothetical protein